MNVEQPVRGDGPDAPVYDPGFAFMGGAAEETAGDDADPSGGAGKI